uniref:Uncharacterized protein n=1 Tax=Wuchereria bancrofti TaxID=6293 RepID=A0A1I8EHR1_WUCBA
MSKLTLRKIGIYFLPWLFSIVVNYSTATVLNRFYHFDNDGIMVDDEGTSRWFFAKPGFIISKKQMNERVVNSLLRNAWIGKMSVIHRRSLAINDITTDAIKKATLDFLEFDTVRKQFLLSRKGFVIEPYLSRFASFSGLSSLKLN